MYLFSLTLVVIELSAIWGYFIKEKLIKHFLDSCYHLVAEIANISFIDIFKWFFFTKKGVQVFSGSDDCKLKCFDIDRTDYPVFVIKEHSMGVTSILSDVRNEFRLYSGSYDENLHFWDTRFEN
jgi:WD40 repeat protein